MAAKKSKNPSKRDVETAKKVAKKVAPNASQRKKIYKKSGIGKLIPYLLMLFAVVLAISFIIVRLAEIEDAAGVVGYYIQYFFCGLLGFAAFFVPLLLGYVGVLWCILDTCHKPTDNSEGDFRAIRKKTVSKTVFSVITLVLLSIILGVIEDPSSLDIVETWESAAEDLVGGGLIGAPIAFLFTVAFEPTISLVILLHNQDEHLQY